jgi:hypothetical protein
MKTPFPGMDPYLEHPAIWQDVHNRLIAAIADAVTPMVAPRYYVALERRTYLLKPDDVVFIGRPDIAIVTKKTPVLPIMAPVFNGVLDIDYSQTPVPPLSSDDTAWAAMLEYPSPPTL